MNKATLANPNHTLGVTTPALTGRCCGSPVFVPPTPAASHGVSTLRLSSLYLQYDSNGTFRNVPLLLSHACPCAGWFDGYEKKNRKAHAACWKCSGRRQNLSSGAFHSKLPFGQTEKSQNSSSENVAKTQIYQRFAGSR